MVVDLAHAMYTAWTRAIVWFNIWCSCISMFLDLCTIPSPHRLISARGIYMVIKIHYSSAFEVPALGALKSYRTRLSQEGVLAVLMMECIQSMTSSSNFGRLQTNRPRFCSPLCSCENTNINRVETAAPIE